MNKPSIKVSVAFITYNHEPFIRQALESVLMQKTDFPFEIVIGEDCSTDGTREIVKEYKEKYPDKIKIITSGSNVGPMPNVVRTYKACKGKYIAILEGDDYWTDPEKLQKQVDLMEANPEYSMCFTDRSVVDRQGKLLKKNTVPEKMKRTLESKDIIGNYTPPTQTVLFRRACLKENILEGLLKVFNGDTFLFAILASKGKLICMSEVTAAYRLNVEGHYTKLNYISRLEKRLKTNTIIIQYLDKKNKQLLRKDIAILNQRLYTLYFYNKNWRKFLRKTIFLITFDMMFLKVSFFKANKLLIKNVIIKDIKITD